VTSDQVLADVRAMLIEIIGAEYALSLDIGMGTAFEADLELESIEFVKLSAMLAEHYGNRIDFVGFLADKNLNEIIDMTVGDVVTYIASCLDGTYAVTVDA
jgi:acyl carrier protein